MADPTLVNSQITDAVTQTNTKVLGEAPAMAMGSLYQTIGNAIAMAAANAVYAQQQSNIVYQAATTMCVKALLGGGAIGNITMPGNINENSSKILEEQINMLKAQVEKAKAAEKKAAKTAAKKSPEKRTSIKRKNTSKSATKKAGK
ncbi:RebB family R body protein [Aliikangiella coralliicola]|uniref:RebB family R body protein n=1 Tax=Aliikangiella coralliicola TaxID=2592383 RepID=UPI001AEF7948